MNSSRPDSCNHEDSESLRSNVTTRTEVHAKVQPGTQLTATSFSVRRSNAYVPRAEVLRVGLESSAILFLNGEEGSRVSLSIRRVPFSGGHLHDGGPSGELVRSSVAMGGWPQNAEVELRTPDFAGTSEITLCDSNGRVVRCWVEFGVRGLIELTPNRGLVLCGCSREHPQNHWGTPKVVNSLYELGDRFHQRLGRSLWVNDLSLPFGGRLDCNSDWEFPHRTHFDGRDVDINWNVMTVEERDFFAEMASGIGFAVELHGPKKHWHLHM
jgi:hypothetical protein